ncbi:DUF6361 family protein [Hyalangium gracile]|uniref:DUF6361 family protein n=1 Tax=Hyalangium gracile TaxID=394092 RepID=UPI001CC91B32|nr:DUF6361 family protein [Hyalangium gracile]
MESSLGWVYFSRRAFKRAEALLAESGQGVLDEMGFLAVHSAYANRFFPGTSVLHTRLRYVLFIPWIYEDLSILGVERGQLARELEKREMLLTGRLEAGTVKGDSWGIIGVDNYQRKKPAAQPASQIYWGALGHWRVLRAQIGGQPPSRTMLHRSWRPRERRAPLDDDKTPLSEEAFPFTQLPPRPPHWENASSPLDFRILSKERQFLRNHLLSVTRRDGQPSFLSRLVERGPVVQPGLSLYDDSVLAAADRDDREALERARRAAALAAVGRGVYAALVEQVRENDGDTPTPRRHRENLSKVLARHGPEGSSLDVEAMREDADFPEDILEVLRELRRWVVQAPNRPEELATLFEKVEYLRKKDRARLSRTLMGRARRSEWDPESHPGAEPLHYRWHIVRNLLSDLGQD